MKVMNAFAQEFRHAAIFTALLALTAATFEPASAREWSDATGKFRVEAEFVELKDDVVQLRRDDGKTLRIPLGRLSAKDRAFLKEKIAEQKSPKPSPGKPESAPIDYGPWVETKHEVGVKLTAESSNYRQLKASVPLPGSWPEQQVEVEKTNKTKRVSRVTFRDHPGGSRQLVVHVPNLRKGETAEATVVLKVRRRSIRTNKHVAKLATPPPNKAGLRDYLRGSEGIEISHRRVKEISAKLADETKSGWPLAKGTFDWVHSNMKYVNGELRGAAFAAVKGLGDCEEYTSLFVALCRANKIPARCVWIPGHTYPEFYLTDTQGRGWWIPCEPLERGAVGALSERALILQKGDSFKIPERRKAQRYLAETLTGLPGADGSQPKFQMILRQLDDSER